MIRCATFFAIVLIQIKPSNEVKCVQCIGHNCNGPTCKGDYCIVSKFGESAVIKGCISGNLLKNTFEDQCERFDESKDDLQLCLCNDANNCNSAINRAKTQHQQLTLLQCTCSNCSYNKQCRGEYCTYSTNEKGGEVVKGCSNQSMPLIDRIIEDACVTPQISMMHTRKEISAGGKGRESCFCTHNYCNRHKSHTTKNRNAMCEMAVDIKTVGKSLKRELGKCYGEYCFNVEYTMDKVYYRSRGCISYREKRIIPEEIHDQGCMHFKSLSTEIRACFGKEDQKNNPAMMHARHTNASEEYESSLDEHEYTSHAKSNSNRIDKWTVLLIVLLFVNEFTDQF